MQKWTFVASFLAAALSGDFSEAQDATGVRPWKLVWEYSTPNDTPLAIAEDAQNRPYLYVALKQGGLAVLDVRPATGPPREIARLGVDQFQDLDVVSLTQSGRFLYLALGDFFRSSGAPAGLAVVDIQDVRKPRVTARWKSAETLRGAAAILVDGPFAYLGAMSAGVMFFDVSRPGTAEFLGQFQPDIHFPAANPNRLHHPNVRGMAKRGNTLYVAYDAGGLRLLDVSDPKHPEEIGRYINPRFPNKPQAYNGLILDGHFAYAAVDYAGMEILDIRNPKAIKQRGWWNPWRAETLGNLWFNSPGHTNQIAWNEARKQVWLAAGDSELQVVDVSLPAQPKLVGRYGVPKDRSGAWGLTRSGERAYLGYIRATVPFQSSWSGIRAVEQAE